MTIDEDKKASAVEKIRKSLVGGDVELGMPLFIDAGIKGLRPQHMDRLILNLDKLEEWLHGRQHKHVLNFFQHIDRLRAQEEAERRRILLHEQLQLQLDRILGAAKKHSAVLSRKRSQLVMLDDYGVEQGIAKWRKEILYFIENVAEIDPRVIIDIEAVYQIIDSVANSDTSNPTDIAFPVRSNGIDFEIACAERLESCGWRVARTKTTGDQGVDLIASLESVAVAIQCKDYNSPVGNKAVQEIYAGKNFENCDFGVVVGKTGYTDSAKQLANKLNIYLLHHEDLDKMASILFGRP